MLDMRMSCGLDDGNEAWDESCKGIAVGRKGREKTRRTEGE